MENKMIKAFSNNDTKGVIRALKEGEPKENILNYCEHFNSWELTMIQGWILQELNKNQNNGLGIYELV